VTARAAIVGALVLVLGLTACSDEPDTEGRSKTDCAKTNAATVEDFVHTPLPPSVISAEVFCKGFTDTLVRARITMPRAALRPFVRDAGLSAPLRRGTRPFVEREGDPPTWQIKTIEHVLGLDEDCLYLKTPACAGLAGRKVVVDLDEPGRAIVYLEAFTT
jgi:hypothetical protein